MKSIFKVVATLKMVVAATGDASDEESLEAAIGVEPMMEVLQTSALPLGYAAWKNASRRKKDRRQSALPLSSASSKTAGAGEGTRTLDLLHGKQTL